MNGQSELPADEYRRRRRQYYARFPEFWATFPAGADTEEEYAVYGAIDIQRADVAKIRRAAERLYRVMSKVAAWVQIAPDGIMHQMGIPPEATDYARLSIPGMPEAIVGRFEFAMTGQGPKLLELNAETPSFIVELFDINGRVCRDFDLEDPNASCSDGLRDALLGAIEAGLQVRGRRRRGNVVFTSYGEHREDRGTAEYLLRLLPSSSCFVASYCPLEELRLAANALRDREDRPIDVLYKIYPTEYLVEDQAPDGLPIGRMLLGLVRAGRLVVINPPASFLLQNKALVALVWALHESRADFLSDEEHDWIDAYILPTYLDRVDDEGLPVLEGAYVAKPVYGREGESILIHRGSEILEAHPKTTYADQLYVYQRHVMLPQTTLLTEQGRRLVNLVFNCFVVGGSASAVGLRGGPSLILDDNAYFVPICYASGS